MMAMERMNGGRGLGARGWGPVRAADYRGAAGRVQTIALPATLARIAAANGIAGGELRAALLQRRGDQFREHLVQPA